MFLEQCFGFCNLVSRRLDPTNKVAWLFVVRIERVHTKVLCIVVEAAHVQFSGNYNSPMFRHGDIL